MQWHHLKLRSKSTVTTATNKTRIVELEHINDPCIPEIVCGVPTFDFILTFLSTLAWFLMLASFIVPNWGQVRIMLRDEDELLLDSGLWQVCYRITEVDGNAPRKCRMIENLDERNGEVAAVKESMIRDKLDFSLCLLDTKVTLIIPFDSQWPKLISSVDSTFSCLLSN